MVNLRDISRVTWGKILQIDEEEEAEQKNFIPKFPNSMGVQIPGAWQGVPTQAQIPAAQQIAQGVGSALPQAAGVVAYPMQQFQVSPQVQPFC